MNRLAGRIAIVTGAAKGMGREICLTLAREGADLALAARDVAPLDALGREIETLGRRALVQPTDVTVEAQVKALAEATRSAFGGRIDILVNAAGITGPIETPVSEIAVEDFDEVLAVNVRGTFLPIKHVLPTMLAQRYGKIVNVSGTSGLRGYKHRAAYSSSKWAIRGLTRTVALEAGPYNVNVNAVHPGIVGGERMAKLCREKARHRGAGWTAERVYQEYVDEMALRRVTTAQDVADTVCFLASDESKNMTGQSITVDGGWDV
jgi:NAD(P)-dependent dehydrogenase (short-subunit alcohol dehydrogenase family)